MNHWLGIALTAYLLGALIEGVYAANQLSRSIPEPDNGPENLAEEDKASGKRHFFIAMTTVSICGAFFWPCRLIHGFLKKEQPQPPD